MFSRALVTLLLLAAPALGADISGTFNANFVSFNSFGVPTTHLSLQLQCALVCMPAAPVLSFRVAGGTWGYFASAPTETIGFSSAGFGGDPNGNNVVDTMSFPAGTAFTVTAKSASCHCGNAVGQGGFVDLTTPVTVVPPYLSVDSSPGRVGDEWYQGVAARPKGSETLVVHFLGAGLDTTVTLGPTDFTTSGSGAARVTPTAAGTMAVTAKLMPYDVSATSVTVTVNARSGGAGGGGGSGGGAGGGGGGDDPPIDDTGCTTAPAAALLPLVALWLRRRRG